MSNNTHRLYRFVKASVPPEKDGNYSVRFSDFEIDHCINHIKFKDGEWIDFTVNQNRHKYEYLVEISAQDICLSERTSKCIAHGKCTAKAGECEYPSCMSSQLLEAESFYNSLRETKIPQ